MKKTPLLFLLVIILSGCNAQEIPNREVQITQAQWAAPEHQRENATVMGFDATGEMVQLKEGTNDFVCIADDPTKEGFSVAAYHKSLEPFHDARPRIAQRRPERKRNI